MKTTKKNILKFFVLVIASVFVSQALCFSVGNAFAQTLSLANITPYVSAMSTDSVTEISTVEQLVQFLNGEAPYDIVTNVIIKGGGTVYTLPEDLTPRNITGVNFNGNFCTILNLKQPLFGTVKDSTISNIYIGSGVVETKPGGTNEYLGSIAKTIANSTINNCINNATVTLGVSSGTSSRRVTYRYAGGIVGYANNSIIINCSNHANVTAGINGELLPWYAYAGGIVGFATGSTKIENCYVTSFDPTDINNPVKINASALAQDDLTNMNTSVISKNTSVHYTGLTHVLQKVNEDVNKWKKELTGYQEEVTGMNKAIQGLKNSINDIEKTIQNHERQINQLENQIRNLKSKQNALKWYQVVSWASYEADIIWCRVQQAGIRIAQGAERVAQGALWVSIGTIEAARAVVYAAITTVQTLLTGATYLISYSVRDMNWLNVTDDVSKYAYKIEAYAYGIGYLDSTNTKISRVYTYNIHTTGGSKYAEFVLPLRFWSESEFLRGIYASDKFETTLIFIENNFYGPISNNGNKITVENSYIFDGSYYLRDGFQNYLNNREIYISGSDDNGDYETGNWYGKEEVRREKHRVHVSIESQQLILSTTKSKTILYQDEYVLQDIVLCVNNGREWSNGFFDDYAGYGTKFKTFTFYGGGNLSAFDAERPLVGAPCDYPTFDSQAKNTFVELSLNSIDWGYQPTINGGLPYLKCRYWQEVA